jgi:hypothetical protein
MNNPQITLDLQTKQILTDLKVIIDSLQFPMLLIGARARLLIFDRQFLTQIIEKQNLVLPQFVKSLDQNAWDEEFYKIIRRFQALQYGLEQETKN